MIASGELKTQVLLERGAREKLRGLDGCLHGLLKGERGEVPLIPGRDVQIWPLRELPPKKGLSTVEGQARMLHDLASIELQAMELGLRTLHEFPEAPGEFREQLAVVTADEGRHFGLCLDALDSVGVPWGSFPTHIRLWQSVSAEDSLLDRIVIVHRYLEGSGLDASDTLLRRLDSVKAPQVLATAKMIRADETGHVIFGGEWYRRIAVSEGLDPGADFGPRLLRLMDRIPRRLEPICRATRLSAGFTDSEVDVLEDLRQRWQTGSGLAIHS